MRYFTLNEFDSPDVPGSGQSMDSVFLELLDEARKIAGIPFVINSGYRTKKHNSAVGGKLDSAHMDGMAADIKCEDSHSRFIIDGALRKVGFTRIGFAKTFVHVDNDESKPQDIIFLY